MALPLDTRVIDTAKLGDIRLSLNLKLTNRTEDPANPGEYLETVTYCQMAAIDYELRDATGSHLGQRTITHQSAGVAAKPTLAQAIAAVGSELRAWIRADRLALSADDS